MRRYKIHMLSICFTICIYQQLLKYFFSHHYTCTIIIRNWDLDFDSNTRAYDYESDAIPLSFRLICDMNEHTNNMYEYFNAPPIISNQRLLNKIGLYTVDTIADNIVSGFFEREIFLS